MITEIRCNHSPLCFRRLCAECANGAASRQSLEVIAISDWYMGGEDTEWLRTAAGTGTYTFQLELRNHILARHSDQAECKGPAGFDCEHGDLLCVYQDAPGQTYL